MTNIDKRGIIFEYAPLREPNYWKLEPGESYDLRLTIPFGDGPIPEEAVVAECVANSEYQRWSESSKVKSFNCPLVTPRVINRLQRTEGDPSVWR